MIVNDSVHNYGFLINCIIIITHCVGKYFEKLIQYYYSCVIVSLCYLLLALLSLVTCSLSNYRSSLLSYQEHSISI